MASNSFGTLFRITTWGETHGKAIGVVIDGCPAGLELDPEAIRADMERRRPGRSPLTSPRQEQDEVQILSGVWQGVTTGAPIALEIANIAANSSTYEEVKDLLRPGHANATYLAKYGVFDQRGGGRGSGRETACRVAAGAIAKALLHHSGIEVLAFLTQVGTVRATVPQVEWTKLKKAVLKDPIGCPDSSASKKMVRLLEATQDQGDSLGGVVTFMAQGLPVGLGDPVYGKLEASLAHGMLSIPAARGFEIGEGFHAAGMLGSEHNDLFIKKRGSWSTQTNHAGGVLGGISTGMPLLGRVAFKPTSSIVKPQQTIDTRGRSCTFQLAKGAQHDPCVAIRAAPVVEAMLSLTLADALLLSRSGRL